MTREEYKLIGQIMRPEGFRLTNFRLEIFDILKHKNLTFQQIREKLYNNGYKNLSSAYNNIEFLSEKKYLLKNIYENEVYYKINTEIFPFYKEKEEYTYTIEYKTNDDNNNVVLPITDLLLTTQIKNFIKKQELDSNKIIIKIERNN